MVSEESLAFVDLMRKDDMDRRASAVRQQTNANERGEQDQASVTEEANNQPSSGSGEDADPNTGIFEESQQEIITTPAVPVSEVALGAEPLQASLSDHENAQPADAFQESTSPAEVAEVFQESGQTPQSAIEQNPPSEANAASPHSVFAEGGPDISVNEQASEADRSIAQPEESLQESGRPAEVADVFQESGKPPESSIRQDLPSQADASSPHQVFTEDGQQAATNEQLRQEGVQVTEIPNLSGETIIVAPEGMPDFDQMLKRFDSDYRPPSNPVGDDLEFPEIEEEPPTEELQNTSEFAESMMSGFSESLEQFERRGA